MAGIPRVEAMKTLRLQRDRATRLLGDEDMTSSPKFNKWLRDTQVAIGHIFPDTPRYLSDFNDIRYHLSYIGGEDSEHLAGFDRGLERARSFIQSMIDEIGKYWPKDEGAAAQPSRPSGSVDQKTRPAGKKVFIVHGRDDAMKESTARTLTALGLEPLILHEQANKGRTIIEKFTDYSDVSFAIVLMSPDDTAYPTGSSPDKARPRARQNVIMELGFFLAKLGRQRVLPLYRGGRDFEMPSDYAGVVYTPYDDSGHWRFKLVQELKACGFDVDANALL